MIKRILALTAFAGVALGAVDSRAGGVILHNPGLGSGSTTLANTCGLVRSQAIAAGRTNFAATGQCAMQTRQGYVNIVFDHAGMPTRAWTYDAQNVGHYYHATYSLSPGVHINNKNYHGPRFDTQVDWYTTDLPAWFNSGITPTPVVGNDAEHPDQFVMDGRLFYKRSSMEVETDVDLGQVHLSRTLFVSTKAYEDHCLMWTKSAETTAPGVTPTALLAHMNNDGSLHEKARWDGISPPTVSCGTYLPTSVSFPAPNPALFQDVQSSYGGSPTAVKAFTDGLYRSNGADPSNPLSIFKIAHQERLSFGLHPLEQPRNSGWLGDGWSPHAQGIIDSSLIGGGLGGLVGAFGGGPPGMEAGFFFGFCAVYFGAVINDIDNGLDPRTGEKPGAELVLPELLDDELLSATDEFLVADWDGDANDPSGPNGESDPSGGANDGAGSYEGGEDGGDSCGTNPNACFPQARKRSPQ